MRQKTAARISFILPQQLDKLKLHQVLPRRVPVGKQKLMSLTLSGLPKHYDQLALYLGGESASIKQVIQSPENDALYLIEFTSPVINQAGLFDLVAEVSVNSVKLTARLRGAVAVDAELKTILSKPLWTDVKGGEMIDIWGQGFEPGSSLTKGTQVWVGSAAANNIQVLSSQHLRFSAPANPSGLKSIRVTSRAASTTQTNLNLGYGLKALGKTQVSKTAPQKLIVDNKSGIALAASGLFKQGGFPSQSLFGYPIPDKTIAFTADFNDPFTALTVGGVSSLSNKAVDIEDLYEQVLINNIQMKDLLKGDMSAEDAKYLRDHQPNPRGFSLDAVDIAAYDLASIDSADKRKTALLATGSGGVFTLNLDELNGVTPLSREYVKANGGRTLTAAVTAKDLTVFSTSFDAGIPEGNIPPCGSLSVPQALSQLISVNMADIRDPVVMPIWQQREAGVQSLYLSKGGHLYHGGQRKAEVWSADTTCPFLDRNTIADIVVKGTEALTSTLFIDNLFDPLLNKEFAIKGNIFDIKQYGRYLLLAMGDLGVAIIEPDSAQMPRWLTIDAQTQTKVGGAVNLELLGSTLIVAQDTGGILIYDLSEFNNPQLLSAGTAGIVTDLGFFKDRLIAARGEAGLGSIQLPGALVTSASVEHDGVLGADSALTIAFNEFMDAASLIVGTNLVLTDLTSNQVVDMTIDAINEQNSASDKYQLSFIPIAEHNYELSVLSAKTVRGTGLFAPFKRQFSASAIVQPNITWVESGLFRRGVDQEIIIHGDNFDTNAIVTIGAYQVPATVEKRRISVSSSSLNLLPLEAGQYPLKIEQQGLSDWFMGGIVIADSVDDSRVTLDRESGPLSGGYRITVTADKALFLPGTKVLLRGLDGSEIRTEIADEGNFLVNLEDNVQTMNKFSFIMPMSLSPKILDIILERGSDKINVGQFSYQLARGTQLDLPNYPPMTIGAIATRHNELFVGIAQGATPTKERPFLIPFGLEIYDTSLALQAKRLSQLLLKDSVTGIALAGNLAYLSVASQGLVIVDTHDLTSPYIVQEQKLAGYRANGLALDPHNGVLALAAASDLGDGFVRFVNINDDELGPPAGFSTILFNRGDLLGQPLQLGWHEGALYVVYQRDNQLYLAIFSAFGEQLSYTSQLIERGDYVSGSVSMVIEHGVLSISYAGKLLRLSQQAGGHYTTQYWESLDGQSTLLSSGGVSYLTTENGLVQLIAEGLTLSRLTPNQGSFLAANDVITLEFNNLINTDVDHVAANVHLFNSAAQEMNNLEINAVNTLSGGVISLPISAAMLNGQNEIKLVLNSDITNLNNQKLGQEFEWTYRVSQASRPQVHSVERLNANGERLGHYFHVDGSEKALILGQGFGQDKQDIQVWLGEHLISSEKIISVSNEKIELEVPKLYLAQPVTALSLTVKRAELETRLIGAVIVMPQIALQDIYPKTGPPRGGNIVTLHGFGFNPATKFSVAGAPVNDVNVLSAYQAEVMMPANNFGYASVTAINPQFPDERVSAPQEYFYAGSETGQIELDTDSENPVAAMLHYKDIVYAVTGGKYQVFDIDGKQTQMLSTKNAELILLNVSDPVKPAIIEKEVAGVRHSFHFQVPLAPNGFIDLARLGDVLFVAGGSTLYQFDISQAAAPNLIAQYPLNGQVRSLAVSERLLYIGGTAGLTVYSVEHDAKLRQLQHLSSASIGGWVSSVAIKQDLLWAVQPSSRRAIALELNSGQYRLAHQVPLETAEGQRMTAADIIPLGNQILISTAEQASVELFDIQTGSHLARLNLKYLLKNGDIFAGNMQLRGSTLAVAGGNGDLQLFDIGSWLNGVFNQNIALDNYFSVTGSVKDVVFGEKVIFTGVAYARDSRGEPVESPVQRGAKYQQIGGGVFSFEHDNLAVLSHEPEANGYLADDESLTVQFNQLLDHQQFVNYSTSLLNVSLDGTPVSGYWQKQTYRLGSQLVFVPTQGFIAGKQYRVKLNANIRDINGNQLSSDYSFRFKVASSTRVVIEHVTPEFGSWRGGTEVSVLGQNFTPMTQIQLGGLTVPQADVSYISEQKLRFKLPKLANMPLENRLVGIKLIQDELSSFLDGAFTYATDPSIQAIGRYDEAGEKVLAYEQQFYLNENTAIGIEGRGFSPSTRIYVNERLASHVRLVKHDLLVFDLPSSTLGELKVRVENGELAAQSVSDTSLSIILSDEVLLKGQKRVVSDGDILAGLASSQQKVTLYKRQNQRMIPLTDLDFSTQVTDLALSERYLVALQADSTLVVYDLKEPVTPVEINRIHHQRFNKQTRIKLSANRLLAITGSEVAISNVHSVEVSPLGYAVDDAVMVNEHLLVLNNDKLFAYRTNELSQPVTELLLPLIGANKLVFNSGRLYVMSSTNVALVNVHELGGHKRMSVTAHSGLPNNTSGIVFNGELALVSHADMGTIYDMNIEGSELQWQSVARLDVNNGISSMSFNGKYAAWLDARADWHVAQVPLVNLLSLAPDVISEAYPSLRFTFAGGAEQWRDVLIQARNQLNVEMNGHTDIFDDSILFTPLNPGFVIGDSVSFGLFNPPLQYIDGAQVKIDLPMQLDTHQLFGELTPELYQVTPASTVSGRLTEFRVLGRNLGEIEQLVFGATTLVSGQFEVDPIGSELTFSLTAPQAGIFSLTGVKANYSDTLVAAVKVDQALTLDSFTTDNAQGSLYLSDSGGDKLVIEGKGFNAGLALYLIAPELAQKQGVATRVGYQLDAETLTLTTPKVFPGIAYELVVVKAETNERLTSGAIFIGIDDTRPSLTRFTEFSYHDDLNAIFNENIMASGYSVYLTPQDYSNGADVDVSDKFMLSLSNNKLGLKLAGGQSLAHNAKYRFRIEGISDLAGNLANNKTGLLTSGTLEAQLLSADRLAPREVSLLRASDNTQVTPGLVLTRGREYQFITKAIDNVDPAEAIKFYYRFASDGLQFNAYQEVNNTLSIQIKEHFQQLTVRIKAVDKAGNFIEKDFTAGVIDPVIAVSDLITQPLKVEELTSAWLRAEVSGDSDLVTGVDMQVNGRWFHAGYHMNGALGSIELNYMNPRLANIAPAEHIQVLIRVRYGFSGVKELVRQYPLHMDATPPQVSIVSPKDGDKLPIGEVAEVVIQSFDKYGIEDVQISVDGGVYQSLTQVNLFQFIPTSEDVVTLQARANDPNGNLGTSAVVRVNPFDPEKGEPELSILSPDNGDNAKEGQAIELELLMRHIEQAELKVLVGADNNDPRNPASLLIERTEGEPERFKYRLQLPNTDENIVVLLELTSGDMVARSFLNLLRDTGIEAETDLVITPAKHVLSGTGLRVIGQVPAQMDDFNSSSSLVITDGDAPDKLFKLAPVDALVAIGAQGALVTIKAQLEDLSGHVQLSEVKLTKQAYLSDSPQESADLTGSSDRIVAVSESLTLDGEDTWLGIQSKQAGFSVRKDNIQVFSQPSGELVTLEASAYGAYGVFNNQGDQKLFILTSDKGVYESQLVSLAGDLVGVNGDLAVMKQGRLITGLRLQGSPTPVIGHMMDDDIKSVSIWRNQVWVLTQEKLQLLGLDELGHKLKPVASFYITDLDHLAVGADDIYLWRNETLKHYKLTDELELVQLNEVNLGIKLSQPQFDGNILWLNGIDSIHGGSHVAIREGEVVGILPWQQPIEVGVNQLYRIDGQGVQSYRLTGRPVQLTALALEGLATEVLIKGVDYRLAAGQLMVTDQNDKPLAYRWFDKQTVAISRQAINTDTLKVYISQGETNELVSSFTINNEPLTDLTIITPLLPTVVAKDASLPLFLQYPVNNRIINATMGTRAWEHNESSAALWWHASQRGNYQVDIDVNAQAMPSRLIDVRDNDPADAELRITAPSNNDRYTEGDWLTLRYVTRHMDVAQFKHAELVVTDFNGNEQVRLLSDGLSGQLSVKLAANDQQETYTLRVRAYFGEQYHFAEDAIGIKVIPQRTNLAFEIYGVGERAYADSHLVLSTKSQTSEAGTAELTVKDADGKILASGIEPLSLTVPVTESLVIEASRQDGLGNISTQSKQVLVAEPYKFTAAQSQFGYDHLLRTSSQTYFFSGQKLLDEQGQLLHRFDARVLAAIHVEDRWLLSLDGIGLTFVDPEHDYQILGTYVSIDKFEHMALLGEHLWASNDLGELNYFTIKGNSLELNNQENLGLIKQISVSLDELWVLTADSLYKQELSTQGQLVSVYNGQGLSVFLMSKQVNWLLSQNGDLIRLTSSGELSISKLDVSGGAQLGHAFGDIWTFDKEKQQLILISQHQRDTYVIGRYPLATSGWLSFDKGKLYSSDGQVWDWSVQEYAPRKVYQTQRQRGNTTDVSLRLGKVISANQGFALLSQEGLPNTSIEQTYPTAYTSDIRRLKASDSMVLAYDSASGKIHKLNTDNLQQSSIIAVQPGVTDFEVQGSKLVLAYGDRLKFYDLVSQQSDELPVSAGDDILSLTLDGQFTYVTTLSGGLYRVSTGDLPLDSFDVNIEPLLQGGGAFKQLVSLGDELFFVSNEGIHTFNFTTRQSRLLVNGAVQAMSLAQGYIWYSQGDNLHRLALNLGAVPEFIYQASADISSIALESNQVLLAVGLKGIELVWLDKTAMTVSPALGSPAFDQYYQLGDRFTIELAQPEGVSVAEYYINDIRVATSDSYPFNVDILIPSSLKNGKAFKLKVVIKDYQGHTYEGQEKRLNLQSETLPLNRFNVELSFDSISYVPRPLRFEAKISQSDQPIRQVEFYLADNIAGPYQLMRKHYGPEFVVRRNFTLAQSGKYIKARAVDIYGNFTESAPQVIRRTIDLTKPELSLSLNSRLNEQGKVTNTHPYELNFSLNDQGSGIELALLKRDDKVIWAGFSEGPSSIIESEHQLGETYHYSLTATDKANNSATVALPVTVVEDAYPELNQSRVPVSIIEQGSFNVGLAFSDDVALEKVDIQWPAFEREYPLAGKLTDDNFVVKDIRQQRINTQITQKLRVLVSDDVQQTSTYEFDITVNPDKSPTPNALTLAVPYAAIYGNLLPISLSGLEAADDAGAAQLNAELEIYYNKVLQQELPLCLSSATRALVCRDTLRKTIQLPEQRVEGDFIEIAVKLTDRLGQMSVGDRKRINLTQKPNLVKFDTNGVASFNSDSVRSGDTAAIQVKVLDISARPVALQKVSFTLIDAKNQRQLMGLVATNESGFARLDMNAAGLQAGHYRIIATLTEYPTIAPAIHLLDILPGDPALLRVRNIAPIMVDNPVELVIEVTDSAENRVFDLDELNVSLAFNHPDFHFGFANNIKISSRYDQDAKYLGETASIAIHQGVANISVSVPKVAGDYLLSLLGSEPEGLALHYQAVGNGDYHSVDNIPVAVLPGLASQLSLGVTAMTNHSLGRADVLEVDETATLTLQLVDEYNNRVTQITDGSGIKQDANLSMSLSVSGNARFENGSSMFDGVMAVGQLVFTLTDASIEDITMRVTDVVGDWGINEFAEIDLSFVKRLPGIVSAQVKVAHNELITPVQFTFTEAVFLGETNKLLTVLDNEAKPVSGQMSQLDDITVEFVPDAALTLNQSYGFSTLNSGLIGVAQGDGVLQQQGHFLSAHVAVTAETQPYLLSLEDTKLELALGDGLSFAQFREGKVWLDEVEHQFDFNQRLISTPKVTDEQNGTLVTIKLVGKIANGESIQFANTLSLPLLTSEGDYDADGISNALEHHLGLNPTLQDSDGNGVADGQEDTDGDGVDNLTELELGSLLDNTDSDGDGLADGIEYELGSDLTKADTDGDGIDDAVEVASGSNPNDANSRAIKPEFVKGLQVTPKNINYNLGTQTEDVTLAVQAQVTVNRRNYLVDVSDAGFFDLVFSSSNTQVAVPSFQGFIPVGLGESVLTVSLGGFSDTALLSVTEAVDLGDVVWQDETVELFGGVSANSVTVIGDVDVVIHGSLSVASNLILKPRTNFTLASEEVVVGGDLNIESGATVVEETSEYKAVNLEAFTLKFEAQVEVPLGTVELTASFATTDGSSNNSVVIYMKHGSRPNEYGNDNQCSRGSASCVIHYPVPGTYFVLMDTAQELGSQTVDLTITQKVEVGPSLFNLASDNALTVAGKLSVNHGTLDVGVNDIYVSKAINTSGVSSIVASRLTGFADASVNGVELELGLTEQFKLAGNLSLNAPITAKAANLTTKQLYPIHLNVGQKLMARSSISAEDAGYPMGYGIGFKEGYCLGSHASQADDNCAYGNYKNPTDFGSGSATGIGGGVIWIEANQVEVELPESQGVWLNIGGEDHAPYGARFAAGGSALINTEQLKVINAPTLIETGFSTGGEVRESMSGRVAIYAGEIDIQGEGGGGNPPMPMAMSKASASDIPQEEIIDQLDQLARRIFVAGTVYLEHKQSGVTSFISGAMEPDYGPIEGPMSAPMLAKSSSVGSSSKDEGKDDNFVVSEQAMQGTPQEPAQMPPQGRSLHVVTVGQHQITDIANIGQDLWELTTSENVWLTNLVGSGRELAGIQLRLTSENGALSQDVMIVANTANSVTVASSDDLYQFNLGLLHGLHQFTKLYLGQNISFGNDIVEFELSDINYGEIWAYSLPSPFIDKVLDTERTGFHIRTPLMITRDNLARGITIDAKSIRFTQAVALSEVLLVADELVFDSDFTADFDVKILTRGNMQVLGSYRIDSYHSLSVGGVVSVMQDMYVNASVELALDFSLNGSDFSASSPLGRFNVGGILQVASNGRLNKRSGGGKALAFDSDVALTMQGIHASMPMPNDSSEIIALGDYKRPISAGSGGILNAIESSRNGEGEGAGAIQIQAGEIILNGILSVTPQINYYDSDRLKVLPAAGSILLDTAKLSGTGKIDAYGPKIDASGVSNFGGAGRIAIYTDENTFTGKVQTGSVANRTISVGSSFIANRGQELGRLEIKIGEASSACSSDCLSSWISLPQVGVHQVTKIDALADGYWRLSVDGANWPLKEEFAGFSITNEYIDLESHAYSVHNLKITEHQQNSLVVKSAEDLTLFLGETLVGVHRFESLYLDKFTRLDIGQDKLRVTDTVNSFIGNNVLIKAGQQDANILTWLEQKNVQLYLPEINYPEGLLLGYRQVFAVAADTVSFGARLELAEQSKLDISSYGHVRIEESLILQSNSELSGDLKGAEVEIFGDIDLKNNAKLKFTKSRLDRFIVHGNVYLANNAEFAVDAKNIQIDGELIAAVGAGVYLDASEDITISKRVELGQNYTHYAGHQFTFATMNLAQGASLLERTIVRASAGKINVTGDLDIAEYAKFDLDDRNLQSNMELEFTISGIFTLAENASIDANVSGYRSHILGSSRYCHGGRNRASAKGCEYGNYRRAKYAGLKGTSYGEVNLGGGAIAIQALEVILNGDILANGGSERYQSGGAGGSVHIETPKLSGSGDISVAGGPSANYYYKGGSGRISIHADDRENYSGVLTAATAHSNRLTDNAGAGTIYLADGNGINGSLVIDNTSKITGEAGTDLKAIGLGSIGCVEALPDRLWRITAEYACGESSTAGPWKNSASNAPQSIMGQYVDLDIDDDSNQILEVVSNTENSLVVSSPLDLSSMKGKTFQGIHQLKSISLRNFARVDFGGDRVEVTDIQNSEVMSNVYLTLGAANDEFIELLNQSGASVTWSNN